MLKKKTNNQTKADIKNGKERLEDLFSCRLGISDLSKYEALEITAGDAHQDPLQMVIFPILFIGSLAGFTIAFANWNNKMEELGHKELYLRRQVEKKVSSKTRIYQQYSTLNEFHNVLDEHLMVDTHYWHGDTSEKRRQEARKIYDDLYDQAKKIVDFYGLNERKTYQSLSEKEMISKIHASKRPSGYRYNVQNHERAPVGGDEEKDKIVELAYQFSKLAEEEYYKKIGGVSQTEFDKAAQRELKPKECEVEAKLNEERRKVVKAGWLMGLLGAVSVSLFCTMVRSLSNYTMQSHQALKKTLIK